MKKIALLLALVMTLGVASVASAAEVTTSGEVSYTTVYGKPGDLSMEAVDSALLFDGIDFKLAFNATISDQISATLRFRPDDALGVKYDKAALTIKNFGLPLSVTLGRASVVNDPGFGADGFGMVGGANNMVNVKTDAFNGFSGQVLSTVGELGGNNVKALIGNYSADFGSFAVIAKPVTYVDKDAKKQDGFNFAVSANVPVPSTPVKALVEVVSYRGVRAIDGKDMEMDFKVGAEATLAGVDTYVKYYTDKNIDAADLEDIYGGKITAGVSKEINGATYALDLESQSLHEDLKAANDSLPAALKLDENTLKLTFGVTVAF